MKKIPFALVPARNLFVASKFLLPLTDRLQQFIPSLNVQLKQIDSQYRAKEYLAMSLFADLILFLFFTIIITTSLVIIEVDKALIIAAVIAVVITFFVFLQQIMYPRLLVNKKVTRLERDLLPALQSVLVQINSGVPLFNVLVAVSKGDYGEVSKEFGKAVKEINAGTPEEEALEKLATRNPSLFFRRALWQLVNGMKAGGNISIVLEEILISLSGEQVIEIQSYGSRLNPLAMFYMLMAVVIPALGVTFIIMITSFVSVSDTMTKLVLWGLYAAVTFFQFMFLGLIKTRRPNLISD